MSLKLKLLFLLFLLLCIPLWSQDEEFELEEEGDTERFVEEERDFSVSDEGKVSSNRESDNITDIGLNREKTVKTFLSNEEQYDDRQNAELFTLTNDREEAEDPSAIIRRDPVTAETLPARKGYSLKRFDLLFGTGYQLQTLFDFSKSFKNFAYDIGLKLNNSSLVRREMFNADHISTNSAFNYYNVNLGLHYFNKSLRLGGKLFYGKRNEGLYDFITPETGLEHRLLSFQLDAELSRNNMLLDLQSLNETGNSFISSNIAGFEHFSTRNELMLRLARSELNYFEGSFLYKYDLTERHNEGTNSSADQHKMVFKAGYQFELFKKIIFMAAAGGYYCPALKEINSFFIYPHLFFRFKDISKFFQLQFGVSGDESMLVYKERFLAAKFIYPDIPRVFDRYWRAYIKFNFNYQNILQFMVLPYFDYFWYKESFYCDHYNLKNSYYKKHFPALGTVFTASLNLEKRFVYDISLKYFYPWRGKLSFTPALQLKTGGTLNIFSKKAERKVMSLSLELEYNYGEKVRQKDSLHNISWHTLKKTAVLNTALSVYINKKTELYFLAKNITGEDIVYIPGVEEFDTSLFLGTSIEF